MKRLILKLGVIALLVAGATSPTKAQQKEEALNLLTIDTPPSYPGGMANFYKLIATNLKYPETAQKYNIEGKVFLSFVIEKDGTLSDAKIERSLGFGTDEEALRVIKLSEKWKPGIQKGNPVRVRYNIPIQFANKM